MSRSSFLIQLPLSSNSLILIVFDSNSACSFAVVASVVAYVVMNFLLAILSEEPRTCRVTMVRN